MYLNPMISRVFWRWRIHSLSVCIEVHTCGYWNDTAYFMFMSVLTRAAMISTIGMNILMLSLLCYDRLYRRYPLFKTYPRYCVLYDAYDCYGACLVSHAHSCDTLLSNSTLVTCCSNRGYVSNNLILSCRKWIIYPKIRITMFYTIFAKIEMV